MNINRTNANARILICLVAVLALNSHIEKLLAVSPIKEQSLEKLQQAFQSAKDGPEKWKAAYKIGDKFLSLYRDDKDPRNLDAATKYYEVGFEEHDMSLESLKRRVKLASCLEKRKRQLLKEVIEANPEKILESELTPDLVGNISHISPWAAVSKNTNAEFPKGFDLHTQLVEARMTAIKQNILQHFEVQRKAAMLQEIYAVSKESGIRGLQELLELRKDNPDIVKYIRKELISISTRP